MVNGIPDGVSPPSLPGYEILAYAGSGGTAHVFRVRSTADGREAAVKVLRAESTDEDLFRNEFAVLSSIEHPNILPALDYGMTAEGKPYVIFPWIAFDPLGREAFRDEKGAFRADRFALVVRQIADALTAVHTRGIVHGDLKPGNIALTFDADGKPCILLMDFGLCRPIRESGGGLSGTLEYIAPELIRGEPPTPASDLYALGCLLFECLTGSPPFVGDSPREVLRMHLAVPATFPAPADGIPAACIEWVRTLMEKDPAFRYRSAAHLAAAVDSFLGAGATASSAVSTPLVLPAIPRDIEDAKLRELLAGSHDRAVTAIVTGADGVGKSTLIRRLRAHVLLEGSGMTIAAPRPGDPPFRPVLDLLRGIPTDRIAGEAAQHASVLVDAFGNIFPGFEPAPVHHLPADAAKLRIFHAAAALLTEASPCRVVAIEDAHRTDTFTQEFLPFLVAYLASHETRGFFLIMTMEEMDPAWSFPEDGTGPLTVLALEPYPREVIGPVLNRLLGQNVSPSFLSALMRYSEGYPGRILEFLEYCRADGVLVRTESGWIVHERENLVAAFPRSLEDSFRRKISRLDRAELGVLAVIAESPVPVPVQTVAFAADMPVPETMERLNRLADMGLVSLSDRTVYPLHPLLVGIIESSEDEKRRTHDRYYAWYRSREARPEERYAIAVHAFGSSARDDSIPLLLDAAEQRRRLYDYRTAESLIAKALAVTREKGETDRRFEILAMAGETANLLGKRDAEEEYIEEMLVLAARSGSPDRLARVYRHQTDYHLAVGEFDRARKSAEKALEQYSAAGDRKGQAYCHRKIGFAGYRTQPGERVIEQYRRALEMYRVEDERADEA
ncbi:MAG: protein kinase, partial [Bacteroidota bacterium]|nr:protein kinase [Bacteroidota bacterium]